MKFLKENNPKGVLIPSSALKLGRLDQEQLELHVLDGATVVLNSQMTATEVIDTAQALHQLASELYAHLALACGQCCGCGECPDPTDEESPLDDLPEELLHAFTEAGICMDLLEKHLLLEDTVYGD